MEGIFISLIVFSSIIGCVIYYAIMFGKFGEETKDTGMAIAVKPAQLLYTAGKKVSKSSQILGNGLKGASFGVLGAIGVASAGPLAVGAAVYETAAGISREVSRGVSSVSQGVSRRKINRTHKNLEELNEKIDDLYVELSRTSDKNKRSEIQKEINKLVNKLQAEEAKISRAAVSFRATATPVESY